MLEDEEGKERAHVTRVTLPYQLFIVCNRI